MALLILTQENVDLVKLELRANLPQVASAHLTEALAAALGFRTNAALRTAIAAELERLPSTAFGDAESLNRRLSEFGYAICDPNILSNAIRQRMIYDRPYAEFKRGDVGANNAFFSLCQETSRPIVTIAMARQYAELQWDCITIDANHDAHVRDGACPELVRSMFARFQIRARGARGKPDFCGSAFVGRVERLLPEAARDLAEDFFSMLYAPAHTSFGTRKAA
jgi:hypothetical protein